MRKVLLLSLFILLIGTTGVSFGTTMIDESESNDTADDAQDLGTLAPGNEFIINGLISDGDTDVDFYKFNLSTSMSLYFDIDYADDDCTGLDSQLWVFDSSRRLIATNDDSDVFDGIIHDLGSIPNGWYDSLIGALSLDAGDYFVAVTSYGNDSETYWDDDFSDLSDIEISGLLVEGAAVGSGFVLTDDTTAGTYQLKISETYDVVPEPTTMALFCTGLLGVAGISRRKKE